MLEEKLAALRESYRRTLPGQLDALAAVLDATRAAPDPSAATEAARLAHRLKGTAGSYGFDVVAAELEAVEDLLERAVRREAPLVEADRQRIDAALARARAALGD